MSLPLSLKRCQGIGHDGPGGVITHPQCVDCFRRIQGVADYMAGERGVVWMEPSEESPCPERLAPKKERHA